MKDINVLSLFDGMSCGQQALERSNIKVNQYFASEIDKYAITVTMANYPNTIQLGSVIDVDGFKLPKIDLMIGGSPCQSFSFAGKRKGMSTKCETEILTLDHYLELKSDGYEFEGQSYLFWEYMRLLNEVKPTYFLLENVMMGEKWERILSKAIGVKPIEINSSLLSAQNRRRLYWTNIGMQPMGLFGDLESIIQQPKDKGILLKDILESEVDEKYFISDVMVNKINRSNNSEKCFTTSDKSLCLAAGYYKQGRDNQYIVHNMMPRSSTTGKGGTGHLSRNDGKTYCLDTGNTNAVEIRGIIQHIIPEIVSVRKYNVDIFELQKCLKTHKKLNNQQISDALNVPKTMVDHWFRTDTYFSIPDKDMWLQLKLLLNIQTNEFDESIMTFEDKESVFEKTNRVYDQDGIAPTLTSTSANERILVRKIKQLNTLTNGKQTYQQDRIYDVNGIAPALSTDSRPSMINTSLIRRLTPTECERLQTVKDDYTNHVSDSQRYKMLGNGWTVDVIAHIFSYLK
jgi:DNA-cytosine methyltransferase